MSKLFDRLQYSFSPANTQIIFEYSDDVRDSMNSMGSFVPDWGYEDMRNNDVNSYLVNPVAGSTQLIIDTCQNIYSAANSAANVLGDIANTASQCKTSAINFYNHTNRLSGLVDVNSDTVFLPHYDTAIAIGKAVTHLIQQADGYSNGSTILGSFTSVLVNDELMIYYDSIKDYPNTINSSIELESSNLDPNVVNTIITTVEGVSSFLDFRRNHDENFYTQSRAVVDDFNNLKRFMDNGQTETYLIRNYLQSSKLQDRLE